MFNKYNCVKQNDSKDCGPACIATIIKYYGKSIPIAKLRETAGTDMIGTSAYGLVKAFKNSGFDAKVANVSPKEDIYSNFPKPAIAHIQMESGALHYVVIYEVSKKRIIVADPAKGIIKYTPEDFFKIWTGILILAVPTESFKKVKSDKGINKMIWNIAKNQRSLLINVFVASILVTVLGVIGSFYFKFLFDDILPGGTHESLFAISIGMIVLAVFKIIIDFFRNIIMLHISQNIDIPLLLGYYNHVIDLPMNFFGTRKVGEIISRFSDASQIRDAISSITVTLMIDSVMTLAGGIILYLQSKELFIICFVPIIIYLLLVVVFKKPIENINRKVMEENAELISYIVESIEGIETVKASNGEDAVKLKTEKNFIRYIKSIFKYGYINGIQGTLKGTVKEVFGICLLWIGTYSILKGNISIGTLITFNSLLVYFIGPIERIINLQSQIQSAIVATDRLSEILDLEIEKEKESEKISSLSLNGDIKLKDVSFRYGTRKLVLEDINIDIKRGEKIALVGESGSGKTTIAKLIMNFYDIEKGEITLNSYNIKDINKDILREKIAYVSQDSFFFSESIKDNLRFGNSSITYEEIVESCKKAQIHDFINSMPLRYDTVLEEKGLNFSGGQRQRLAIARALLKKPDILIMDEATSNLDAITEKAIEETVNSCTQNITTIIIAHRLSTILRCDKIYVIDSGKVIEYGSHNELIEKQGYYYKLFNSQTIKNDNINYVKVGS